MYWSNGVYSTYLDDLVDAVLVSEILLLSKMAKFPFWTMGYSPWSSKNLINRNRLKKFMQVGINVTCVHQLWWTWLFWFWRYCYIQKRPNFPFGPWAIVHGHQKNLINRNRLKKLRQVGVDVTCMYTNFGGRDLSGFEDIATFKNGQIFLSDHGL